MQPLLTSTRQPCYSTFVSGVPRAQRPERSEQRVSMTCGKALWQDSEVARRARGLWPAAARTSAVMRVADGVHFRVRARVLAACSGVVRAMKTDYAASGPVPQVTRALAAVPFASADVERLPDEEETDEWQPLVRPPQHWDGVHGRLLVAPVNTRSA